MADDVVLDVLIELKEEGLEVAHLVASQIEDLADEVRQLNRELRINADEAHDDARAMLELAGATDVASGAAGGRGLTGFIGQLVRIMPGGPVMGSAIVGILALSVVFAPLLPLLAGATVLLSAFAVGVTALATTLAIGMGAVGALAAAIVFLGESGIHGVDASKMMETATKAVATQTKQHATAVDELTAAQAKYNALPTAKNYNALWVAQQQVAATTNQLNAALEDQQAAAKGVNGPMERMHTAWTDMVAVWQAAALPIAINLLNFFTKFIPVIQNAGLALMDWFGPRQAAAMSLFWSMLSTVGDLILSVGTAIGHVVDFMINNGPSFQQFFRSIGEVGGRAINGLIDNLLRLTAWFLERLPTIAPIVGSIMGGIGHFIQGVGTTAGHVVDFFIEQWPKISKAAGDTFAGMRQGWNAFAPILLTGLKNLGALFGDVLAHLRDLKPLLPIVGAAFAILGLAVEGILTTFLGLARALEAIVAAAKWVADHFAGTNGPRMPGTTVIGPHGVPITMPGALMTPATQGPSSTSRSGRQLGGPTSVSEVRVIQQVALLQSIDNHLRVIRNQPGLGRLL